MAVVLIFIGIFLCPIFTLGCVLYVANHPFLAFCAFIYSAYIFLKSYAEVSKEKENSEKV